MIFSERRLAVALSVFMLTVFFLCVFEYKFLSVAAIVSVVLTAALVVLRLVLSKSNKNKFKTVCGYMLFFVIASAAAIFFCVLRYNISEKPVLDYPEKYEDTPVYIKAEIQNASSLTYLSKFDLKVFEVNGEKTNKFNLTLTVFAPIEAGEDEIGDILETASLPPMYALRPGFRPGNEVYLYVGFRQHPDCKP